MRKSIGERTCKNKRNGGALHFTSEQVDQTNDDTTTMSGLCPSTAHFYTDGRPLICLKFN